MNNADVLLMLFCSIAFFLTFSKFQKLFHCLRWYFEHAYCVYWATVSCSVHCKYLHHVEIELCGDIFIAFDPKSYHIMSCGQNQSFWYPWWYLNIVLSILCIKLTHYQKHSPGGVLLKRCSLKFRKIHRKTPVLESLFQ